MDVPGYKFIKKKNYCLLTHTCKSCKIDCKRKMKAKAEDKKELGEYICIPVLVYRGYYIGKLDKEDRKYEMD